MKIRNGFVSNSSTTSFQIYGLDLEYLDDIFYKYKDIITESPYFNQLVNKKYKKEEHFMADLGEILSEIPAFKLQPLNVYFCRDAFINCIGADIYYFDENRTIKSCKDEIENKILDIFNLHEYKDELKKKFHVIIDEYRS